MKGLFGGIYGLVFSTGRGVLYALLFIAVGYKKPIVDESFGRFFSLTTGSIVFSLLISILCSLFALGAGSIKESAAPATFALFVFFMTLVLSLIITSVSVFFIYLIKKVMEG